MYFLGTMAKRKKASAKQRARLKALRRKFSLGEFTKKKPVRINHTVYKRHSLTKKSNSKMAKKKRRSVRRGMMSGLQQPLVAGVTYAFVQPFVSQFLTRFNVGIQDELMQILAAVVLKNVVRNQIVNNWANAAIIINTASLARDFTAKLLPTPTPAATTNSNNGMVIG
jgi:hypothetical protein